ncbi:uncharacterized protein Hap1MRO34_006756 [Clarias gariepinus]|uniref:doublesex- and mab-3-related transcription factor A1-like n=1 Tax=Clarias gariepinus TaxID=13013 RepID=UPI00234CDFBA|nr:doublesex- and mab-3-related transcription factor A1-like [Clarias gariepinus]
MEHVRSRRSPKCARCRNHGFSVPLRGHAGRCRFARCDCWKCALITERTRITARQREAGAAGSGVTEPDGEEDKTYTELQQNPETAGLREQPRVPWECFMPHTPLSAVHLGDLPLAMPFPLHGHYGDALRFGPVTFPHVPPAALVEHRQV